MADAHALAPVGYYRAAHLGDLPALKPILENGGVDQPDDAGLTALFYAAAAGQVEAVDFLLTHGADPLMKEPSGLAPIHIAAKNGHEAVLERFFQAGTNIEYPTLYGETPFFLAARRGHLHLLPLFQRYHSNLEARNTNKGTPLMAVAKTAHNFLPDVDPKFIKHEFQQQLQAMEAEDLKAQYKRLIKFGKELLKLGADVHARNAKGETPLLVAARWGELDLVKAILRRKADIHAVDHTDFTALHYAARHNHLQVAKVLIERGANVNCQDSYGFTPAFEAIENHHFRMLKVLVANGADVNIGLTQAFEDYPAGFTAYDLAMSIDHKNIQRFLTEREG